MRDAVRNLNIMMNSGSVIELINDNITLHDFKNLYLRVLDTLEKCRRLREEIISHDGMVQEAENLLYGKKDNVDNKDKSYLIF